MDEPVHSTNPYEPPVADSSSLVSRVLFRWRVVPTTLTALVGAGLLLAGLRLLISSIGWMMNADRNINVSFDDALRPLSIAIGASLAGGFWLFSAYAWWRGKLKIASILSGLGILTILAVSFFPSS